MTQTPPTDERRTGPADDNLDRLLSDYFKAQLKRPWPAAPATAASAKAEPSVLAAARTAAPEAPRNRPAPTRDPGSRSRLTLVASVALLLGTVGFLSNGFRPGERGDATGPNTPAAPGMLQNTTAGDPAALKELNKDKATHGPAPVAAPKIEKIELP